MAAVPLLLESKSSSALASDCRITRDVIARRSVNESGIVGSVKKPPEKASCYMVVVDNEQRRPFVQRHSLIYEDIDSPWHSSLAAMI